MVRSIRFRHLYRNSTVWASRKITRSKFKVFSPPKSSKRCSWQVGCGFHNQAEGFLRKVWHFSLSVRQQIEGQSLWKKYQTTPQMTLKQFLTIFSKMFYQSLQKTFQKCLKKLKKNYPEQSPWTCRWTLNK